jgi:hypothetical protein
VACFVFVNLDVVQAVDPGFQILQQRFHHGAITALDICARKSIVATSSLDNSVRIWYERSFSTSPLGSSRLSSCILAHCRNYLTKTLEIVKYFTDDITTVALHPSGFQALIGFSDKLRFMNLLIDDMR